MFIAGKLKYKKLQNDARPENLIQPSTRIEPPPPPPQELVELYYQMS